MNRHASLKWLSLLLVLAVLGGCAGATPTPTPVAVQPAATSAPQATPTSAPPAAEPTATSAPEPTAAPAEREPVVLNFMRPGLGDDALKETEAQMKPFSEQYPWITVETLVAMPPDLGAKIQTSVAGGAPPDIAFMPPGDFLHYAQSGQLLDLTAFAEKEGFDWKDYYYSANLDVFVVDGELYGVGDGMSPYALTYNKNMFDEAGLPYPDENWTWDDMLAAAQKLTKDKDGDGKTDQWGIVFQTWNYRPWIWMNGGDLFNEDFSEILITEPEVVEALQWMADLRFKHKVLPPVDVLQPYPGEFFMFMDNKVAMSIDAWVPAVAFFYPGIKDFQWDVAPLPKHPRTGLRVSAQGNWAIAAFAQTKHPEETYLVWRWMTSDPGMHARSMGYTGSPLLPAGPPDQWPMLTKAVQEVTAPANVKVFLDALAYTRSTIIPLGTEREIYDVMDPYLDELWLGKKSAAEVAPLIKAAVEPLLK